MARIAKNVLLLTVDCLRADHLGCYGYERPTSPNIDRLAAEGAIFLQAVSCGGGTPEAFPSILASVPPPVDHKEFTTIMKNSLSLAEVLGQWGLRTAAFHSNPYLSRVFHYRKGFDVFEDGLRAARLVQKGKKYVPIPPKLEGVTSRLLRGMYKLSFLTGKPPIVRAETLCQRAASWLANTRGPFFLWIHFMDTHQPYMPPARYVPLPSGRYIGGFTMRSFYVKKGRQGRLSMSPDERDVLIDLYDASIRYTDYAIGLLLEEIRPYLGDCLVILTADHGDEFGEHGCFGHYTLYDGIIRVPLIIVGPGTKPGTVYKEMVSTQGIGPTVADSLGIGPVKGFRGQSLTPLLEDRQGQPDDIISVAHLLPGGWRCYSYRTEEWKYIRWERTNGTLEPAVQEELYDLTLDPKETRNLSIVEGQRRATFETLLTEGLARIAEESREVAAKSELERIKGRVKRLRLTGKR